MKKEMLEEAVLDYISEKFKDKVVGKRVQTFFTYSELVDTVLSFAELLNKNIEELEQGLEQTEKDLADYQFNYPKIKELEKENAELKKEIDEAEIKCIKGECPRLKTLENKQLTKAKDLLLRFVELKNKPCAVEHSVNMLLYENVCVDTKKFLEEK